MLQTSEQKQKTIGTLFWFFTYFTALLSITSLVSFFVYIVGNIRSFSDSALKMSVNFCGLSAMLAILVSVFIIPLCFFYKANKGKIKVKTIIVISFSTLFNIVLLIISSVLISAFNGYSI